MRTLILSMLAVAIAGPAMAQRSNSYTGIRSEPTGPSPDWSIARRVGKIDQSIHDGRHSGQLTRREARALRRQGAYIEALRDRYADDWLSQSEQAELTTRVDVLDDQVFGARSLQPAKTGD